MDKHILQTSTPRLGELPSNIHKPQTSAINKSRFSNHREKIDQAQANDKNTEINTELRVSTQCTQTYWGKVKPYRFDSQTHIPQIIITSAFPKALALNLLIIIVLCLVIPIATNHNLFGDVILQQSTRLLYKQNMQAPYPDHPQPINLSVSNPITPKYVVKRYSIYIYSGIWTIYQTIFLFMLLLGNPGYGDPLAVKQISIEEQNQVISKIGKKNYQGYNRCTICKAVVDNSVYHCEECDLCCQGFSHHCQWIGKCVGYKNEVILRAYFYGFVFGIMLLVLLILYQSVP